ncbi:MAG: bacteriochlorophyll 4-vinyl reductase, partial [Pseudomonadota bacterium]
AHMLDSPPQQMTDEAIPARLYAALWRAFPQTAPALAKEAGARTADYVIANRIPKFVQMLLRLCPRPLAARLLLMAIKKNAWTFVGSGQCSTRYGRPCVIDVADNPLAMPDCVWHSAVFQRMFDRLVTPGTLVSHRSIGSTDAPVCRFEIRFPNTETKRRS